MTDRYEIRLAGAGGQGLIFAGVVLAEAAGVYGRLYVAQSQVYGIVSRGGTSRSEVVLSSAEIDFPEVERQDLLVALNQYAFDAFSAQTKPGGVVLTDPDLVKASEDFGFVLHEVPVTRIARERVGTESVANVVALGVISVLTDIVDFEHIKRALQNHGSARSVERNLWAVEEGRAAAAQLMGQEGIRGGL